MPTRDPRIDAYIAKAAPFAQPILKHLRKSVHAACPAVVEEIKWGMPAFAYKGPFCGMAAFKQHAVFGFWKHALLVKDDAKARQAMGSFGCLRTLADLPSPTALKAYIRAAKRLNDEGIKAPRNKLSTKKKVPMHPALKEALAKNRKARATFDAFPPSRKREYLEWIAEAKGEDTRARRLAQAIEWLAAGKPRNWKYMQR
ncbi:MAG: YdeI/OmpD-associated family protein [Planctomycetota bacterium]